MTAATGTQALSLDWERLARAGMHETQVRIVEAMTAQSRPEKLDRKGERTGDLHPGWSPNLLSALLDEPLGNVSYHVRQLAAKGLLLLAVTEPRRGAVEHYYRLA